MRALHEGDTLDDLSSELFPILQLCVGDGHLLPNLKTLKLWKIVGPVVPFVPLFLSPRTTSIRLCFRRIPKAVVASVITTVPTLCPRLQVIRLRYLPKDPMIIAAVSRMVLAANQNTLQQFHVDSPLTEEASEVVYKLPNLRGLLAVIERDTLLSPASLPNLTDITINCEDEGDWPQLFHRATLGKLESVTFYPESEEIGDFLGAFERAAHSSSVQNTLSKFRVSTSWSWNPNYSSLLPFTQLVYLEIRFSCINGCSSRVDDDVIINLSRAMPKLQDLILGHDPCRESTTGVTGKGLVALALHCSDLDYLCIHIQVANLSTPPASPGISGNTDPTSLRTDCALTELTLGEILVPEGSRSTVALNLLRIFPHIETIYSIWDEVQDAISNQPSTVQVSNNLWLRIRVTPMTPV